MAETFASGGVSVRLQAGALDIEAGGVAWRSVRPVIDSDQPSSAFELRLLAGEGNPEEGFDLRFGATAEAGEIQVRLAVAPDEPVLLVGVDFSPARPFRLDSIELSGLLEGGFDRAWKQGWQSWTPACTLPLDAADTAEGPPVNAFVSSTSALASSDVVLLAGPGLALCAGLLSADRFLGRLDLDEGRLACRWLAGALQLDGGTRVSAEVLRLDFGQPAATALDRYASAVSTHSGVELAERSPSGWCSWYYYFAEVSEQAMIDNLRFLESHRRELPIEYVQLDDGYQADIGDWIEWNEKFPHGPRWLADQIHRAGFRAGLWLAPFIAGENSRLAVEHPDWLVRGDDGRPVVAINNWGQDNYALDLTHPGVEAWLAELFTTVADDWDYDYVKVDFVYAGAVVGRRHDPRRTPVEAYRAGLAAIRRSVGDRFVLGCGALQLASVGLVDGMRIGPDVMPWWRNRGRRLSDRSFETPPRISGLPAAEASIRNTLNRLWMHARLWVNDPDYVLVRETDSQLTKAEIETLVTAVGLSAGMTVLSDNMPRLSERSLRQLGFILPPLRNPARVVGLLDSDMPARLELESGERMVVALFNWDDGARDLSLRVDEAMVFDVRAERSLGRVLGEVVLADVAAHGCRLLTLSPADGRPRLLASSFHIGQGALELVSEEYDAAAGTLHLKLAPVAISSGTLWISWPFGSSLHVSGDHRAASVDAGVARVDLDLDQPTELTLSTQG